MPRRAKSGSSAAAERGAGVKAFNAGRPAEALERFRRAQALGDRGPELRAFIAHALSSAGRHDEAIAEFASLLKDFPRFSGARDGLAPIMLEPERLPRAEKALRAALAEDPKNAAVRLGLVEILRLRGQAALSAGDPASAAVLVREALSLAPARGSKRRELLEVLRSCGCAHQFAGELPAAAALFRSLLELDPRDARAYLALAGVMRASGEPAKESELLAAALRFDRGALTAKDRGRALVVLGRNDEALAAGGGLAPADRFRALMKLGRHKLAVAAAERILDAGATLNDIRVFWDPWEWSDRRPREDRLKELAALERALGPKSRSPWLHYYRAELLGPDGLDHFAPLAGFPPSRYGWMFSKAGLSALCAGRFETAVKWFKIALANKPVDWRSYGFLAEAYLCLRRPKDADAQLEKMQRLAGEDAGQALAWRGAVDLWLGRYEAALVKLEEACRLDAQCAFCWRAAALLKLGRREEAIAGLDETLRRFPRDFEAYVWRGEAKRELGLYQEALADLNEESYDDPKREPPIWLWALVNRALVKAALGDRAGLTADFAALPAYVVDYLREKTGSSDMEELLRAALALSRGFRREEYRQAIWMAPNATGERTEERPALSVTATARGVAHFNAGRFEDARLCFAAAKDPQGRVFLGHVEAALGRRDAAVAAFTAAIRAFPRHLEGYRGLANLLLNLSPERVPAAERTLRRILAVKPGSAAGRARLAEVLRVCGEAFRAAGELDSAEQVLARALQLGGGAATRRRLADVVHRRGQAYLAAGNLEKAERELRRVLALNPRDRKSRRGLDGVLTRRSETTIAAVLRRRSLAHVSAGRLAQAESTLRRALKSVPRDRETGRLLLEVLRMRAQARQDAQTKARLEKAEAVRALTEELIAAGQGAPARRRKKVEALLVRILRLDPGNARACLHAGAILRAGGAPARGRRILAEGLRLGGRGLGGGEAFAALLKLGRYKAAVARAERALDAKPTVADLRAFWDPWDWAEAPLEERRRELAAFERALGPKDPGVWAAFFRAGLREPGPALASLRGFSLRRYGWMLAKTGHTALCGGRFTEAETSLRAALRYKTADWRTRGSLAETLLCLGREAEAFAELERAALEAPPDEAGEVLAWRGLLHLWRGRYAEALSAFDEALRLGSAYASAWRGAALLKLGRAGEALEQLDRALARYPRDLEAYVWRGEAKRALGRPREALADLGGTSPAAAWLWARVNRALARRALGDRAGFDADFASVPAAVVQHLRARTGRSDPAELLESGLELARGFRREEFAQAPWMI